MIRTALTISLDPTTASHTSYIINGAHLGYLAPSSQKNHVQTSNRALQMVAAFKANLSEQGSATRQRERLNQWQLFTRELQQHGSQNLNTLMTQYQVFPDLVICLDEKWLRVWQNRATGLFLVRNQTIRLLDPLEITETGLPAEWQARMSFYALKIEPDDYYLFLQSDTFQAFSPGEAVTILTGLRQLPAKMSELNQTARDRRQRLNETWLAMQVLRLEPDAEHAPTLSDQVGRFWQSWRKAMNRNEHESPEEQQSTGPIIDRAAGTEIAGDYAQPVDDRYRLDNETPEQVSNWRHRWLGLLLAGVGLLLLVMILSIFVFPGKEPGPSTSLTTASTSQTTPTTTQTTTTAPSPTPQATPTPKAAVKMKVSTSQLNIRQKPDKTAKLVTTLRKGDKVTLLGEPANGWVQVELADGRKGYAWYAYLVK